jgi:hypothetical protein
MWKSRIQQAQTDLQPFVFVTETAYLLDTLLEICQDTDIDGSRNQPRTDSQLESLLSSDIDPLIQLCFQVSCSQPLQSSVFMLNCMSTIVAPLKKYNVAGATVSRIEGLIEQELKKLVDETSRQFFHRVGLLDKFEILDSGGEFHPMSLSTSFKSFYATLFTATVGSGHVDSLVTSDLRERTRTSVAENIANLYERIYIATKDLGIATHTPDQVRALLDL